VLRLGTRPAERAHFLERRGEMLANAGRSAEAAEALQAAATELRGEQASIRALNRRSGELWLRSGYVNEGLAAFERVLRELGLRVPASERAAFRTALCLRLKVMLRGRRFHARRLEEIPPETSERLDTLWGATTSLAMLKPMSADVFQLRHLLEALAAGDAARVLRSLVHEASFESLIGGPLFDRRCRAMIKEMMQLAEHAGQPYLRAWALQGRGMVGWFHGDWQRAWEDCDEAIKLYLECRGVSWELAVCDVYRLSALTYLGRIADLVAIVPEAHRGARERGDLYAAANLAFFESFVLLAHDRGEDAIAVARRSLEPFPRDEFLAIHYGIAYAIAQGELYRGRPEAAWQLVERDWPAWRASGMASVQGVRVEIRYLRARVAAALLRRAREQGAPLRALRRTLGEDIGKLEREGATPAAPMALALRAALAALDGRDPEARARLQLAARDFDRHGMALHAAAARHHLACLSGHAAPRAQARDDERRFAAQGVAHPESRFHLAITGFRA
jgi:tetratricopeptide (TPR) repeat protein